MLSSICTLCQHVASSLACCQVLQCKFAIHQWHADPADTTLVWRRVDTGKKGVNRYQVYYSRGTNSNESINPGIERVVPTSGKPPYICTIIRWYLGRHNLRRGEERLQWSHIGCWDLILTYKVCCMLSVTLLEIQLRLQLCFDARLCQVIAPACICSKHQAYAVSLYSIDSLGASVCIKAVVKVWVAIATKRLCPCRLPY